MIDVNINVIAHELDPTKRYVLEIKRGDLDLASSEVLVKRLQQLGVKGIVVVSETGEAINVKQLPEEV